MKWLSRWGEGAARHPVRIIVGFVLLLVVLGGAAGGAGAAFSNGISLPGTDSQKAADLVSERFPAQAGDTATLVFASDAANALQQPGAQVSAVEQVLARVRTQPEVAAVAPLQVSADGRIAYTTVQYTKVAADLEPSSLKRLEEAQTVAARAGLETSLRGPVVNQLRERAAPVGEVIGLLAALVLVTLLFRSFWATVVTLAAALVALMVGVVALTVVAGFVDVPSVAPTIAVMLGLGAGVDYALFVVARFRDRLRAGDDPVRAAANATGTVGVSVLTAGAIVVISICGLYVTGIPVIGRMGMAAALVVAVAAMTAVVLVPALLRLAGRRVLPRAERSVPLAGAGTVPVASPAAADAAHHSWAARLAVLVARRPWTWATAVIVALLALASPTLNLQLGQPDDGTRPAGDTMRTAYDRLAEGFGPGFNGPLLVVADLRGSADRQGAVRKLSDAITRNPDVAAVGPAQANATGDTAVLTVIPRSAPQARATSDLVGALNEEIAPDALAGTGARAYVGGATATFDDLAARVAERLPLLLTVVIGLSLILLGVVFRSVLLPVVSAVLNLLSIGAAYGVVTLAFQTSWGTALLGVSQQPIVSFVPMLMFAILFGLSMDYNVFLLSAVRDERRPGVAAGTAVVRAVGRTAGLIGTAGAIMTLVFVGFVADGETEVKMIGLGLATAVLIDVTLVRLVLAPAILEVLGERAWWVPRWLDRRLPHVAPVGH
ncbi:membrane protein [Paractinoplanes abujensis]|uniref:RND superfamily putative drug exporter n=1 Tax=Paractinoplanes abujensis TaxID=882441 RepID=A0A7W7CU53_9ACTN|nr:MMPL family transporter [Actinoplanes abujensis]MBB4693425.1 RND superfamily putative drug exporter [Actinoplanes abujensis]GID24628.1 membrane protein [Actinoplanes abujensis]